MNQRLVRTVQDRKMLIRYIEQKPLPFTSTVKDGDKRPALKATGVEPDWNGEGLPPADIECEVFDHEEKQYSRCKTLSAATMSGERACATIEPKGHFGRLIWGVNFRPIRTQAQREREEIIIDALRHVDDPRDDEVHPRQYFMDALHTLYDAGMLRKEAE